MARTLVASAIGSLTATVWLRRAQKDRVVSVGLDVLLKILRTLEGLAAEVALVWLQWHVNADVRGDVISLHGGGATATPLAGEIKIVGAFSANMAFADVILWDV